jgi:hypothetical protein
MSAPDQGGGGTMTRQGKTEQRKGVAACYTGRRIGKQDSGGTTSSSATRLVGCQSRIAKSREERRNKSQLEARWVRPVVNEVQF